MEDAVMFEWFKRNKKKEIDHDTANDQFEKFITSGYLASALKVADEAAMAAMNTSTQAFWIGRKAAVYVKCGDYPKVKLNMDTAMYSAAQFYDNRSLSVKIYLLELMMMFPLSYEDLESNMKTLENLQPTNKLLHMSSVILSGREMGKPFYDMLKMQIASHYSETMIDEQKSMAATQWGLMIQQQNNMELPMEMYREAISEYVRLLYELAYTIRMKLISNGKHDPEEYLMILRPTVLTIHTYVHQYPYDMEMQQKRDEMFFHYAHIGDIRSVNDTVIRFELLNEHLQICRSCGLPIVKGTQICWNCGTGI